MEYNEPQKLDRWLRWGKGYGYRRMTVWLRSAGYAVNHKRVSRLMKVLGLEAIYPKPNLSKPNKQHLIYPYLLRGLEIGQSDKVWATDIT